MSRGPGKIETAILETLISNKGEKFSAPRLAAIAYDLKPDDKGQIQISEAHTAAVRRALSNLHRKGMAYNLGRFKEKKGSQSAEGLARSMWGSEETARDHALTLLNKYGSKYLSKDQIDLIGADLTSRA